MSRWIVKMMVLIWMVALFACTPPIQTLSVPQEAATAAGHAGGNRIEIGLETESLIDDLQQPCGNALLSQSLYDRQPLVDLNSF